MAKLGLVLTKFVSGDTWRLNRTCSNVSNAAANSATVTTVYWTVKTDPTLPDASAIFQRVITTSLTSSGQITDAAPADGTISFYAIALSTQTILCVPGQEYYYDLQAITSAGGVYTLETGIIIAQQGVTTASS